MNNSILEKCTLFSGISLSELRNLLNETPHHVQRYEKGSIIFHLMEPAARIGIIMEGRVEAQKSFPNGSQVNVSVRMSGEMIGPAAVFSKIQRYPCDMVALDPVTIMLFEKNDLLMLMQKDMRIAENFISQTASTTFMLQQRLELLSYKGIAQKAAFWLLIRARETGKTEIHIPGSVSRWAMLMNVSRPSLHRELRTLERERILSYTPPVIRIHDPDALQDVLSR